MSLDLSHTPVEATPTRSVGAGTHDAWFYRGPDELLARSAAFVLDGLRADEAVCVMLPSAHLDALRSELGSAAASVTWAAMDEVGRNPGRLLGTWSDLMERHAPRPVRGIGEPAYAGRTPDELVECRHHEALLDAAIRGSGAWIACPYDIDSLPDETIAGARTVHEGEHPVGGLLGEPLPPPPRQHAAARFGHHDLGAVRRFVRHRVASVPLDAARQEELVLAVNELAANSIRHGGGGGIVRAWVDDRGAVIEVQDAGRIDDPMVGRRCPPPDGTGGRGVWMAHNLCDLVQVRSGRWGTTVRVRLDCD